jgi:hypothetical protein
MAAEFQSGTNWEQSSGPIIPRKVAGDYLWPHLGTIAGKDALADGLHPVLAIGGITAAEGRPLNVTGVMVTYDSADDVAIMNIADGFIVRQYVDNTLTYAGAAPATFEQTPVPGQPVYVDDSDDLAAGTTLSMSPLNEDDVRNPMAGILFWCQDEYKDIGKGGPNATDQFDTALPNVQTDQEYCVMLFNGWRELA